MKPGASSKFEEDRGSIAMSEASFGGHYHSEQKPVPKPREEIKLKGRENFKIQINDATKLSLGKVVGAANDKGGGGGVPKLDFRNLKQT